jgi:hypothetical protein
MGSALEFFKPSRILRQGFSRCPSLLFLIIAEGLDRSISEAKRTDTLGGLRLSMNFLIHLLFVDGVLFFCDASGRDVHKLKEILDLYSMALGI